MYRCLHRLLIALILLLGATSAYAQNEPLAGELPVPYGASNMGREFWVAFPANWDASGSAADAIRLYVTSTVRTQVKVWAGPGIKKVFNTIPNEVVAVYLTPTDGQMFVRDDTSPVPNDRIYKRRAVHIIAEAPIVVYAINRTAQTSEGMLLLPASALGREYVVGTYGATTGGTSELPSQYMIIAPHNATRVTIHHPMRTPNHSRDETFTIDLDSGDVWSAMSVGTGGDVSGVIITSNNPVAVTAGVSCANIPSLPNSCCCNHLAEMMTPTEAWGKVYHAGPIATRQRGAYFRIFAKEPHTKVRVNGVEYATLTRTGGEEGTGWFEYRALGLGAQEFTADKPIMVVQYNPSQALDAVASKPFAMVLTPQEQYYTDVLFSTPDTDFQKNFMNVVFERNDYDNLEITVAGRNEWKLLKTYAVAGAPLSYPTRINGIEYSTDRVELPAGVYQIRSKRPFSGMLYGFSGDSLSYGYPIALRTAFVNGTDTEAPGISKTRSCDGTVLGIATDMPIDDGVRTNISSIELDHDASSNYELSVGLFTEGVSATATYRLTVTDKTKPAQAVVIITDQAGNVTRDTVTYGPVNLAMTPLLRDYGTVRLGQKKVMAVTITNEGDAPAEVLEFLMKSMQEGFKVLSPTGKIILGPKGSANASVNVQVEFTADIHRPGSRQAYSDSLGIRDICGTRYLALVNGLVVKPMIEVSDLVFQAQENEEVTREMIVRNASPLEGSNLTVTAFTGPNHNPSVKIFDVKSGTALALPFVLAPNETRNLMVTAKAPQAGHYYDTIFFTSDAMDVIADADYGSLELLVQGVSSVDDDAARWAIGGIQVLPNPVRGHEVVLEYSITRRGAIDIELLNVNGQVIRTERKEMQAEVGPHRMRLDITGLAAGTYFARIRSGVEARMKRFVIVQ